MKWRRNIEYPRPKSGDKRTRVKFAWLPTDMQGDQTVWLEYYFIEESWREHGETEVLGPYSKIIYQGSGWRVVRLFAQPKT